MCVRDEGTQLLRLHGAERRALYVGMTSNLDRRIFQHKMHRHEGFTDDYNATRLVFVERYSEVVSAITREKQIKRWRREKKNWLVEMQNPQWRDLAAEWFVAPPTGTQGPSTA